MKQKALSPFRKILREINPITIFRRLTHRIFGQTTSGLPVQYVGSLSNRSESDDGRYVAFVSRAATDYQVFKNFKKNSTYRAILEHASQDEGLEYLKFVSQDSPALLAKVNAIKVNDEIGSPITYDYPPVGRISPSTLRYLKVASDLHKYFGENIGDSIAEIGVGYGGQCLTIDQLFHFQKYTLFDLSPVLDLVTRYLECHTLNGSYQCTTLNQLAIDAKFDLVISNYAFSELPSKLQRMYIKKVLSKCKKGYLTMNSGRELRIYK